MKNHWILLCVVSVVSFILFVRSTRRAESLELAKEQNGRVFNKAEQAKMHHLEGMVDDLQKQLWDAQRYEKQLIEQLKNIGNVKPLGAQSPRQSDNQGKEDGDHTQGAKVDLHANDSNGTVDMLGCQDINKIRIVQTVGKGFSKIVQEGMLNGMSVAVKSAGVEVKDVQDCLKSGMYKKEEDCYVLASYKVLKEAMMLKQLKHSNIVRLLGLCLRSERSSPHIQERGMTVVVELGDPVQIQELAELPYIERVKLSLGLAQLISYLAESPLGSVAILDFREDQFVIIDKQIKLTDVDDLTSTEPDCDAKMQCLLDKRKTGIKCASNMKCPGMNAKKNVQNAYRVFLQPLLGFEVPPDCVEKSQAILKSLRKGELDAQELATKLDDLLTYALQVTPKAPTEQVVFY